MKLFYSIIYRIILEILFALGSDIEMIMETIQYSIDTIVMII